MPSRQKITAFLYKYRYQITILICVLVYMVATLVWVHWNTRPPHWDMGRHLFTAQQYLNILLDGQKFAMFSTYFYYPPLTYWFVAIAFQLFGSSIMTAVGANLIWALILAFSFLSIAGSLKRPRAGIFAFIFFITMPLVSSVTKDFQLDFPLTAMLAANLAVLLRSQNFKRLDMSLLYGLTFGFGMITKWMFLVFAIWPLIVVIIFMVRDKDRIEKLKNLFVGLSLGYLIASPWYLINFYSIKMDFLANGTAAGVREGDPAVASLAGLLWYPNYILEMYLRLPWLIPFLLAGSLSINAYKKRRFSKEIIVILALGLGGLFAFTLLRNKDVRYIMPIFIVVSLAAGLALDWLVRKKKAIIAYVLIGLCIVSFFATSFVASGQRIPVLPMAPALPLVVWSPTGYITGAPVYEGWCLEEAVKQSRANGSSIAYSGPDTIWFNVWALQYYASRENLAIVEGSKAQIMMYRGETIQADAFWQCQVADGSKVSLVRVLENQVSN